MTGSLVVGTVQARHQQNRAQSKARAAYEAAQSDRALMVRNPIQPRRVIYGENVVSGVMAYVGTHGHAQYNDYLRLVLVLAGHELDSISEIRVDDHVVKGWTDDEWAHDARFCKELEADGSESAKGLVQTLERSRERQAILFRSDSPRQARLRSRRRPVCARAKLCGKANRLTDAALVH